MLTDLHSVWVSSASLKGCPSLLKGPCCWLITGWRSRKSIFLRIIAHPPARNIPQAPLSCFISSGNPVLGDRAVISPQRGRGAPLPVRGQPGLLRGPGALQLRASLPVGAKSDRAQGVLLGPCGHVALRPFGP